MSEPDSTSVPDDPAPDEDLLAGVKQQQRWVESRLLILYRHCAKRLPDTQTGRYAGLRRRVDAQEALFAVRLLANYYGVLPSLKGLQHHDRMPLRNVLDELESLEMQPQLAKILNA